MADSELLFVSLLASNQGSKGWTKTSAMEFSSNRMGPNPIPSESSVSLRMGWYCWWKKSCTTWDVFKEPVNDGMSYQPQLVSWISSNSIYFHCFAIFFGAYFLIHGFTTLSDPEMNENTWEFSWSDALTKRSSLSFEWVLDVFCCCLLVCFAAALMFVWKAKHDSLNSTCNYGNLYRK